MAPGGSTFSKTGRWRPARRPAVAPFRNRPLPSFGINVAPFPNLSLYPGVPSLRSEFRAQDHRLVMAKRAQRVAEEPRGSGQSAASRARGHATQPRLPATPAGKEKKAIDKNKNKKSGKAPKLAAAGSRERD